MAANVFVHGKLGTITLGGTAFAAEQFTYQEETTLDDITYTLAGGASFQVILPGYNKASGTITFNYDSGNQPNISPQNMVPGTLMALVLSPDGTRNYSFNAYSGSFQFGTGPKNGPVTCSTTFQSSGTITRPTT